MKATPLPKRISRELRRLAEKCDRQEQDIQKLKQFIQMEQNRRREAVRVLGIPLKSERQFKANLP